MSHASVWWECISYRCLNVLIVHAYILEILIFVSVVRNRIPVHHGTVCAGRPWEHSSTCQWALPVLFCCTSHILDYPVPIVPWTSQLPIPLPGAQLVLTSTPAKWWTQPSPLCIARAVHGCFCSYSFGVKLKQAIKEKLSCPIYTNQWRDLHLS